MKILITEAQYEKILLKELSNRGLGLLAYIRQNYETMGNSFTRRNPEDGKEKEFSKGEIWKNPKDIVRELINRFHIPDWLASDIVDYHLHHTNPKG